MKIIKIKEVGLFKYPDQNDMTRKKTLVRLDYYIMIVKTRCGHHRTEIRPLEHPEIFLRIKSGEIQAGQDLILLMETFLQNLP